MTSLSLVDLLPEINDLVDEKEVSVEAIYYLGLLWEDHRSILVAACQEHHSASELDLAALLLYHHDNFLEASLLVVSIDPKANDEDAILCPIIGGLLPRHWAPSRFTAVGVQEKTGSVGAQIWGIEEETKKEPRKACQDSKPLANATNPRRRLWFAPS